MYLKSATQTANKKPYKKYTKRNLNTINSHSGNLYNTINKTSRYSNVSDLAVYFNIEASELNQIFQELKWAEKSGKWWISTNEGFKSGAKQEYSKRSKQKYIVWDSSVKYNKNLINAIKIFKDTRAYKLYKDKESKKEKGDRYEAYVADFFKENGYYVWEHGKEKGIKDGGIDLFVKNGKYCYFVQCKDWEKWKVDDKAVKATQTDVRNYMIKNPTLTKLLGDSKKKILYVTSKECLTKGAYRYIEDNKHIIEYKVIGY